MNPKPDTRKRTRADDCHCSTQVLTLWILGIMAGLSTVGLMLLTAYGVKIESALFQIPTACLTALGVSYVQNRNQGQQPVAGGPTTNISTGPQGSATVAPSNEPAADDAAPGADQ